MIHGESAQGIFSARWVLQARILGWGAISYSISYHLCLWKQNSGQEKHSTEDPYNYTHETLKLRGLLEVQLEGERRYKERNTHVPGNRGKGASHKNTAFQGHGDTVLWNSAPEQPFTAAEHLQPQWFSLESERGEFKSGNDIASCASPSRQLGLGKYCTCQPQFPQEPNAECFPCLLWGSHED